MTITKETTDIAANAAPEHLPRAGELHENSLADVERGTPAGDMLRRYWHPIAVASEVQDRPVQVRVLGENLILFKTGAGEFGLVHPQCAHRGTSLYYGKVEERGIRCCYHGWLFSAQGKCLEQPCEPGGGAHREKIRQPSYPVKEQYGLVFAYLGSPELQPALPKYDVLESLQEGETIHADGSSIGSGGASMMPCNWLQTHENVLDSWHVFVLHSTFSATQFSEMMAIRPLINWEYLDTGACAIQRRVLPEDGGTLERIVEVAIPNVRIVPDPRLRVRGPSHNVAWTLPMDRFNTRIFTAIRHREGEPVVDHATLPMYAGKCWQEMTEEEHQRFPGDFEAQVSQGKVANHALEHLASSDKGVVMFRRLLKRAVELTQAGEWPLNAHKPGDEHVHYVRAGNFILK